MCVRSLVDTGANISVVASGFVKMLEERYHVPTIPIAATKVKGVFPDKVQTCKKQVMLELTVGQFKTNFIFLVLTKIKFGLILGVDFIKEHQGIINLCQNTLTLKLQGVTESVELNPRDDEIQFGNQIWHTYAEQGEDETDRNLEVIESKVNETNLNREARDKLRLILEEFIMVFNTKPGKILNFQYRLRIVDWAPFLRKPYPVSEKYRSQVTEVISEMCKAGVISQETTPYANSLVTVQKPDGSVRVCLDARALNEKLVPEYDSVPCIKDIIRRFANKRYFTSIDLTSSYHHIELEERSRLLTGFWFDQRTYVFNRLPFGIKNSGAALIRALDRNLDPEVKERIIKYVDDIIIATEDLAEHYVVLRMVLENLHRCNFKVNLKKSKFAVNEILFVGHIINFEGIRPNPAKIQAIRDFPVPTRVKHIRQFLGMCQFFSDHCDNYTDTVAPLQETLKIQNRWKWGPEQDRAFEATKRMMAAGTQLGYPDFTCPFIIQSDASLIGVGGVLYQEPEGEKSRRNYLAFTSRKLRSHEKLYSVTELEMLAVVFALKQWRKIVFGFRVILRTDHRALTFMFKSSIASERVRRWSLYVQQFDAQIEHCPGRENVIPDILSRNPCSEEPRVQVIELVQEDREVLVELESLAQAQGEEPEITEMIEFLKGNVDARERRYARLNKLSASYHIVNNLLHKFVDEEHSKLRIVVPSRLQRPLIYHAHRITGHGGIDKIHKTLGETFTWSKMRTTIRDCITACDLCQRVKANSYLIRHEPIPLLPQSPRELFAADLYGPLPRSQRGNKYIFVTVDVFSKVTTLYPIQRATTRHVIRRLRNNVFEVMGKPRYLLTDHGPQFTAQEFQDILENLEVTHVMSSIRHPEGNPAERVIREVAKFCRIYCANQHWRWVQVLPKIVDCINSTFHESTQQIPSVIHWGIYPERPWQHVVRSPQEMRPSNEVLIARVRDELKRRADKRLLRWRGKRFHRKLRVGELVLLRQPTVSHPEKRRYRKFDHLFTGPFRIRRVLRSNAYVIEDMEGQNQRTFNAANLKLYHAELED